MSDVTKRGGNGSNSRYYEAYKLLADEWVYQDRFQDTIEANEYFLNADSGEYELRQPVVSVIISAPAGGTAVPSDTTPPLAPAGVYLSEKTASSIIVNWTSNSEPDLQDYRVYKSTVSSSTGFALIGIVVTPGAAYLDLSFSADSWYKVTARDNANPPNESAFSSVVAAGTSAVTTIISASLTSGVAPMGVRFNALQTTHTNGSIDTYREIGYYFDYADGTGNYTHSGESKGIDKGAPMGFHCFETPGTYTVKVRGRDANGEVSDDSVVITVTDPDVVYSGANTVCISLTGDTTGAPAGAQLLTNQTSMPTIESNKRYLFRAGQDFSSWSGVNFYGINDSQIGSFGAGAKPLLPSIQFCSVNPAGGDTSWPSRCTVMDVDPVEIDAILTCYDMLALRCDYSGMMSIGTNCNWYAVGGGAGGLTQGERDAIEWPQGIYVVGCTVEGNTGDGVNGIYCLGYGLCVQDTEVNNVIEHNIRTPVLNHSYIKHNYLHKPGNGVDTGRMNVKMHAEGEDVYQHQLTAAPSPRSGQNVVGYNAIGDADGVNLLSVGIMPQNKTSTEDLEDVIVEVNVFAKDYPFEVPMIGRRITARGNTGVGGLFEAEYTAWTNQDLFNFTEPRGPYYSEVAQITTEAPA